MSQMPKTIAYFCGMKVFPAVTGGHLRSAGIARALARLGYRVRIISLSGRAENYRKGPRWLVEEIEPGLSEETHLGLGIGLLQTLFRRLGFPRIWQYQLMQWSWVPNRVRKALDEADLVLADFPFSPPLKGSRPEQPWFLVSHNLEHQILAQGTAKERRFADWMQRIEAAAPGRYRDIFPCAEEDRDFFQAHDPGRHLRLPLIRCGVDSKVYQQAGVERDRVRVELGLGPQDLLLVFSGSRSWQNLDALAPLKDFCIAERVFLQQNHIHILLLGSIEPEAYRDGPLIATGRVAETAPFFAAADAGLNPITKGSGANIKLFEYLAAGLPVISTVFGVRGTDLQPGRDYLAFEPGQLRAALEQFLAQGMPQWHLHAEQVWQRHRSSCDIEDLVRAAVLKLPDFNNTPNPAVSGNATH